VLHHSESQNTWLKIEKRKLKKSEVRKNLGSFFGNGQSMEGLILYPSIFWLERNDEVLEKVEPILRVNYPSKDGRGHGRKVNAS
jgi:hypothetical protein